MKIIFFSDVHKDYLVLEELLNKEKDSLYYCLGDSQMSTTYLDKLNIISVKGNCDVAKLNKELIIKVDNKKILLLHGHAFSVKYNLMNLMYYTKECNCDIVIFGHTHKVCEIYDKDITMLNPGSLKESRTYILYENKEFKIKRL